MAKNGQETDFRSLTGLARRLGRLSAEKRRAALEISASVAGVSLKASREFVESVPRAAKWMSADDLRSWGELGRRLAMGNADAGADFFATSVDVVRRIPEGSRHDAFQICTRQLVLSSSIAVASFNRIGEIATTIDDKAMFARSINLAAAVATRSAKHSGELIDATPAVADAVARIADGDNLVREALFELAFDFADRTGGMTSDLWREIPAAIEKLDAVTAVRALNEARSFLEFGGTVTIHFVTASSIVLSRCPRAFDQWVALLQIIATHGNAVLITFLRSSTPFFSSLARIKNRIDDLAMIRILKTIASIADLDAESALAAFRSTPDAMQKVSIEQFEQWVADGLSLPIETNHRSRRSYFALESRVSNEKLLRSRIGLSLDSVRNVLRMYVEALTGREIEIEPISTMPQESRISDGKTIYLPSAIAEFDSDEMDFRLFKVLAAYGAGQIEFGTFATDTVELRAAFDSIAQLYSATADQLDAFSLAGYIENVKEGDRSTADAEFAMPELPQFPDDGSYKHVLAVFPEPSLARKIFVTMENARIDHLLRITYRGLGKDLDLMREHLRRSRPFIFDLPMHQVPSELLFQITLCGGATDDARQFYGQIVSEIESVLEGFLYGRDAETQRQNEQDLQDEMMMIAASPRLIVPASRPTVADSLMATSRVYSLFQNITTDQTRETENEDRDTDSEFVYDDKESAESVTEDKIKREPERAQRDVSDLFNAWNEPDESDESDDLQGSEAWSHNEMPEQMLEPGEEAFDYDEWDRDLIDHRVGWSRVIEKRAKQTDTAFVETTRQRYRGVISSIRHQFQLMKPENLTKVNREVDGEDYDLNALVELVVDRRADGRHADNIYTKRLRKQRDVAVSLLLDQSSSTARTITRNPLQPYTHPGRRIIEIEKEGLVLMSEALEAVGDVYSINGFTSEGRRNVKFYVVKDFAEKYSDETERRIGGITFQNNTRLGAAIRHAAHKLLRQENRTKLLIILTDGRPYDHDYGDARYAREDVREALLEAKIHGITPFCITIDRESEAELKDLYGDVGYTIIDDVLSLPERLPNIYRRLTS